MANSEKSTEASSNFEFKALQEAKNYQKSLIGSLAPYLSGNVLEVGAGIGQMTQHLLKIPTIDFFQSVEPDKSFYQKLRDILPLQPLIEGTVKDVKKTDWDGIVSINVLEHIGDDIGELKSYYDLLKEKNGILALFVPARKELYAPIDKDFGHYRRYNKKELIKKAENAGFKIVSIHYYDFVGYFAWGFNFCLLKNRDFNPISVRIFDRFIFPLTSLIESNICRPPIGKNIMVIACAGTPTKEYATKFPKFKDSRIIRFIISGSIGAATDLLLLWFLTRIVGIWYLTSAVIAFVLSFIVSFFLQKLWTFKNREMGKIHIQASAYLLITLCNLCINTLLMYSFVQYFSFHYLIAQIFASVIVAIESFFAYRELVFKGK
jgi:putative flippase GtrA/SAM-dependent methyltransferase